ncbi:MAG: hypothetical protein J6P37_08920 [Lachnospiraceae bacterium]|nr:hypothetical protein [Lachnospiraceae bacterium]
MALESTKVQYVTGHYKGHNLILFAKEERFGDKYADYVIYGNIRDNIKEVVK